MAEYLESSQAMAKIKQEISLLNESLSLSEISQEQLDKSLTLAFGREPKRKTNRPLSSVAIIFKCLASLVALSAVTYFLISCHNPTKRFFSRHFQDFIYPTMRALRLLTLPLVKKIDITYLYQESCLLRNPFFVEPQLDCWPCENMKIVIDLSSTKNSTTAYYQSSIPFVLKNVMEKSVSFEDLKALYFNHTTVLEQGTSTFKSSKLAPKTLMELFDSYPSGKHDTSQLHVQWGINRMLAAQVVRQIFRRPDFVPADTEIALQRYLFIDGEHGPSYELPLTDFANVWLSQANGNRLIVLNPSTHCKAHCNTVSVVLQPKDLLFYNWQYWRPSSYSVGHSKDLTVTYMGSCY